jgi:hypothetical protein
MEPTPLPPGINLAYTIQSLGDLGVLPVITLGAVIFIAVVLYKRFRK